MALQSLESNPQLSFATRMEDWICLGQHKSESKEVKSVLLKVKEESGKVDLKLNIQKTKIMASGLIIPWQTDGETMETMRDFIFGELQNHCRW